MGRESLKQNVESFVATGGLGSEEGVCKYKCSHILTGVIPGVASNSILFSELTQRSDMSTCTVEDGEEEL